MHVERRRVRCCEVARQSGGVSKGYSRFRVRENPETRLAPLAQHALSSGSGPNLSGA